MHRSHYFIRVLHARHSARKICTVLPSNAAARLVQFESPMIQRQLGKQGLRVSALGLGCMGMSEFYTAGGQSDAESIGVIHHYLDARGNFLDTADMYGNGRNEELVGKR